MNAASPLDRWPSTAPLASLPDRLGVVGVVADTHIPDRSSRLHPQLIPALQAAGVSLVLHAGDICVPSVLKELEQAAPVAAVQGNRDFAFQNNLPLERWVEAHGARIFLLHGHLGWKHYFKDKLRYYLTGYQLERYEQVILPRAPGASAIVFGHTHTAECYQLGQTLMFNPGSAARGSRYSTHVSYGLLHIFPGGVVRGEICPLPPAPAVA